MTRHRLCFKVFNVGSEILLLIQGVSLSEAQALQAQLDSISLEPVPKAASRQTFVQATIWNGLPALVVGSLSGELLPDLKSSLADAVAASVRFSAGRRS